MSIETYDTDELKNPIKALSLAGRVWRGGREKPKQIACSPGFHALFTAHLRDQALNLGMEPAPPDQQLRFNGTPLVIDPTLTTDFDFRAEESPDADEEC